MKEKEEKPETVEKGAKRLFNIGGWDVYVTTNEITTQKGKRMYHFGSLKSALWDIVQVEGDLKLSKEEDISLKGAVKILTETRDSLYKEISDKIDERFPSSKIGKYEI